MIAPRQGHSNDPGIVSLQRFGRGRKSVAGRCSVTHATWSTSCTSLAMPATSFSTLPDGRNRPPVRDRGRRKVSTTIVIRVGPSCSCYELLMCQFPVIIMLSFAQHGGPSFPQGNACHIPSTHRDDAAQEGPVTLFCLAISGDHRCVRSKSSHK